MLLAAANGALNIVNPEGVAGEPYVVLYKRQFVGQLVGDTVKFCMKAGYAYLPRERMSSATTE